MHRTSRAPGFGRGLVLFASLFLALGACASGGSSDRTARPSSTTAAVDTGSVTVTETGSMLYARGAVGFVRIERSTGDNVEEIRFDEGKRVTLRKALAAGDYRALAWRRECGAKCPGSLANPSEICGTQFRIEAKATVRLILERAAEESCTLTVAP